MRISFFVSLFFILFSCSSVEWERKTFFNSFSIEVPSYLKQSVLKDFKGIYFENQTREVYLTVDKGSKVDFVNSGVVFSLNQVALLVINELNKDLKNAFSIASKSEPLHDFNSLQYNLIGNRENSFRIKYLITLIEGESDYFVLISWTAQDKWNDYEPDFTRMIHSFMEVD